MTPDQSRAEHLTEAEKVAQPQRFLVSVEWIAERCAEAAAEATAAKEKAEAERDQLRGQFLDCRIKNPDGSHRGWRISGNASINELARKLDPDHQKHPEISDEKRAEFKALSTPISSDTLQADTLAATAHNPSTVLPDASEISGEQPPLPPVGPAPTGEVRTPGTIEVCSRCGDRAKDGAFNASGLFRDKPCPHIYSNTCPVHCPKQVSP